MIRSSFCATACFREHVWVCLCYTSRVCIPIMHSTTLIAMHGTCVVTDPHSLFSWLMKVMCNRSLSGGQFRTLAVQNSSRTCTYTNVPHSFKVFLHLCCKFEIILECFPLLAATMYDTFLVSIYVIATFSPTSASIFLKKSSSKGQLD